MSTCYECIHRGRGQALNLPLYQQSQEMATPGSLGSSPTLTTFAHCATLERLLYLSVFCVLPCQHEDVNSICKLAIGSC
jgi:hypothetical protein